MTTFDELIPALRTIMRLKKTTRRGWTRVGITPAESVADHTFGTSILAFLLAPRDDIDRDRCLRVAMVHDLAESLVGDVIPADGVSDEDKLAAESDAIAALAASLKCPELASLFAEYAAGSTREARWVRDANLIDMAMQAFAYETDQRASGDALETFWESARARVSTETGQRVLAALIAARHSASQ